jgi:phage tail-like protein
MTEQPINYPFNAFNFRIEIDVALPDNKIMVCDAAFQECDGLEMTMEIKTIREGGNNATQIRLAGPMSYGQLTLKRGMTANFDLWDWFGAMLRPGGASLRAGRADVIILAPDRHTERARFTLSRCIPVKLKAPPLNARDGVIAIEEMQLAYESLSLRRPGPGGGRGPAAA